MGRLTLDSCSQVQQLLSSPSRHKLLILAGQFVEDSGDLVLRKGQFSANHLLQIFREEEVSGCCSTASGQLRSSIHANSELLTNVLSSGR